MGITQIISSLVMIAVLVVPGFIFSKLKMCDSGITKGLSTIVVNMCVPALIINAFQVEYSSRLAMEIVYCALLWAVTLVFAFALSFALKKLLKLNKIETALVICALSVPNTGFIGIPLLNALYGGESLFYSSVCEIVNDLFLYTLVFTIIGMSTWHKTKFSFMELINPPIVSVIIGLIMFVSGIRLPEFLAVPVKYAADATTPLAMFIIGAQLSQIKLSEFIGDRRIYVLCAVRLIVMPAAVWALLSFFTSLDGLFPTVFILMAGMPVGSICAIAAQNFNGDVSFATKCVMLSNILCVFTIPVFALLV